MESRSSVLGPHSGSPRNYGKMGGAQIPLVFVFTYLKFKYVIKEGGHIGILDTLRYSN